MKPPMLAHILTSPASQFHSFSSQGKGAPWVSRGQAAKVGSTKSGLPPARPGFCLLARLRDYPWWRGSHSSNISRFSTFYQVSRFTHTKPLIFRSGVYDKKFAKRQIENWTSNLFSMCLYDGVCSLILAQLHIFQNVGVRSRKQATLDPSTLGLPKGI